MGSKRSRRRVARQKVKQSSGQGSVRTPLMMQLSMEEEVKKIMQETAFMKFTNRRLDGRGRW